MVRPCVDTVKGFIDRRLARSVLRKRSLKLGSREGPGAGDICVSWRALPGILASPNGLKSLGGLSRADVAIDKEEDSLLYARLRQMI